MPTSTNQPKKTTNTRSALWMVALLAVVAIGYSTHSIWSPKVDGLVASFRSDESASMHQGHAGHQEPETDGHAGHSGHSGHASHDDSGAAGMEDSIKLTALQQKNLGLKTATVSTSDFTKYVVVPALVVDRPGQSKVQITAHAAGIVTDVFPLERQIVEPGTPLLGMRLIHEDIVSLQAEFLKSLSRRDVLMRECRRLEKMGSDVVAGKRIIEKRNQMDLAKNELASLRQSLILHGIEEEKVDALESNRQLIKEDVFTVPPYPDASESSSLAIADPQYHVQSIKISRGQTVEAGQMLMTLAEYSQLYVEGKAFEDDAVRLVSSANRGQPVSVIAKGTGGQSEALSLRVESVSDTIDPETRALNFYLTLPNVRNGAAFENSDQTIGQTSSSNKFVSWKFRPGQRMEVRIPSGEPLVNKIVLPTDAVVVDGPNAFVFEQNGDFFDRLEVEVLHRDNRQVVVENDGSLLGATIATSGAYRMYLALKNEDGGGFNPHAGHSH